MTRDYAEARQEIAQRIGALLVNAREAAKKTQKAVASELRITASLLAKVETGAWDQLGARVYAQGYLRAYGRLMNVDIGPSDEYFAQPVEAQPEEEYQAAAKPVFGGALRYVSYAVATALIAIPLMMGLVRAFQPADAGVADDADTTEPAALAASLAPRASSSSDATAPSEPDTVLIADSFESAATVISALPSGPQTPAADGSARAEIRESLLIGSVPTAAEPGRSVLRLSLNEEAWIEANDSQGARLQFGLQPAGSSIELPLDRGLSATIGNGHSISATLNNEPFDLRPHMNGDVISLLIQPES